MTTKRRTWNLLAGTIVLAALAACGGGGDGDGNVGGNIVGTTDTTGPGTGGNTTPAAAAVVDKYLGTWSACRALGGNGSEREVLALQKASDTSVNFTSTTTGFAAAGCTGATTGNEADSGTATFVGTKTIGSETVDKVVIQQNNQTFKQVLLIRADGKLYSGVDAGNGGTVDADGYPTTLDPDGLAKTA